MAIAMLTDLIAELQNLRNKLDSAVLVDYEDKVYQLDREYSVKSAQILEHIPESVSEARIKLEFLLTQLTEHADSTSETEQIAHNIIALFDQFAPVVEQNFSELLK